MDIWLYWVIFALILFIIEMFTAGFAVICLSIGAGGAAIAAATDATLEIQLLTFAIVSLVALAGVRPLLKRLFYRDGEKVATNSSAMVGKHGIVCSDVDGDDESGRVIIEGVDWRAKSLDGDTIPKGTRVVVVAIDSVVLTIKKL
ncbi:MAG: NfeD family protein [Rikenellaceae bacterium]|nr:NfeD family protein [Rikenellaceae bacterium]